LLSCVFTEKQILFCVCVCVCVCVISERELVGFLCFQREPDFGLWFLLETFVCVFSERNRFWFFCVCVCVFAVFSELIFGCVCFCVFKILKQIWLKVFCGFLRETDFGLLFLERFCCWVVLFWCCGSFLC
jgi:hypothetical protein